MNINRKVSPKKSLITFLCCDPLFECVPSLTLTWDNSFICFPDEEPKIWIELEKKIYNKITILVGIKLPLFAVKANSSSGDKDGLGKSGFDVLRGTRRWK